MTKQVPLEIQCDRYFTGNENIRADQPISVGDFFFDMFPDASPPLYLHSIAYDKPIPLAPGREDGYAIVIRDADCNFYAHPSLHGDSRIEDDCKYYEFCTTQWSMQKTYMPVQEFVRDGYADLFGLETETK